MKRVSATQSRSDTVVAPLSIAHKTKSITTPSSTTHPPVSRQFVRNTDTCTHAATRASVFEAATMLGPRVMQWMVEGGGEGEGCDIDKDEDDSHSQSSSRTETQTLAFASSPSSSSSHASDAPSLSTSLTSSPPHSFPSHGNVHALNDLEPSSDPLLTTPPRSSSLSSSSPPSATSPPSRPIAEANASSTDGHPAPKSKLPKYLHTNPSALTITIPPRNSFTLTRVPALEPSMLAKRRKTFAGSTFALVRRKGTNKDKDGSESPFVVLDASDTRFRFPKHAPIQPTRTHHGTPGSVPAHSKDNGYNSGTSGYKRHSSVLAIPVATTATKSGKATAEASGNISDSLVRTAGCISSNALRAAASISPTPSCTNANPLRGVRTKSLARTTVTAGARAYAYLTPRPPLQRKLPGLTGAPPKAGPESKLNSKSTSEFEPTFESMSESTVKPTRTPIVKSPPATIPKITSIPTRATASERIKAGSVKAVKSMKSIKAVASMKSVKSTTSSAKPLAGALAGTSTAAVTNMGVGAALREATLADVSTPDPRSSTSTLGGVAAMLNVESSTSMLAVRARSPPLTSPVRRFSSGPQGGGNTRISKLPTSRLLASKSSTSTSPTSNHILTSRTSNQTAMVTRTPASTPGPRRRRQRVAQPESEGWDFKDTDRPSFFEIPAGGVIGEGEERKEVEKGVREGKGEQDGKGGKGKTNEKSTKHGVTSKAGETKKNATADSSRTRPTARDSVVKSKARGSSIIKSGEDVTSKAKAKATIDAKIDAKTGSSPKKPSVTARLMHKFSGGEIRGRRVGEREKSGLGSVPAGSKSVTSGLGTATQTVSGTTSPVPPIPALPIHKRFASSESRVGTRSEGRENESGNAKFNNTQGSTSSLCSGSAYEAQTNVSPRARTSSTSSHVSTSSQTSTVSHTSARSQASTRSSTSSFTLLPDLNAVRRLGLTSGMRGPDEGGFVGSDNATKLALLARLIEGDHDGASSESVAGSNSGFGGIEAMFVPVPVTPSTPTTPTKTFRPVPIRGIDTPFPTKPVRSRVPNGLTLTHKAPVTMPCTPDTPTRPTLMRSPATAPLPIRASPTSPMPPRTVSVLSRSASTNISPSPSALATRRPAFGLARSASVNTTPTSVSTYSYTVTTPTGSPERASTLNFVTPPPTPARARIGNMPARGVAEPESLDGARRHPDVPRSVRSTYSQESQEVLRDGGGKEEEEEEAESDAAYWGCIDDGDISAESGASIVDEIRSEEARKRLVREVGVIEVRSREGRNVGAEVRGGRGSQGVRGAETGSTWF